MRYLGDFLPGSLVLVPWNTNNALGGSAPRTVSGTIAVYKADGTTELTGITVNDIPDHDGDVGTHLYTIDLSSSASFTPFSDYLVKWKSGEVDGATISAWIGHFSIANRYTTGLLHRSVAQVSPDLNHIRLGAAATFSDDAVTGATAFALQGDHKGISRVIKDFDGATDSGEVDPPLPALFNTSDYVELIASAPAPTSSGSIAADVLAAKTAAEAAEDAAVAAQTAAEAATTAVGSVAVNAVTALKADVQWKAILANARGNWTLTEPPSYPGNVVQTLYDIDGTTVRATITINCLTRPSVLARTVT